MDGDCTQRLSHRVVGLVGRCMEVSTANNYKIYALSGLSGSNLINTPQYKAATSMNIRCEAAGSFAAPQRAEILLRFASAKEKEAASESFSIQLSIFKLITSS